MNKKLLIQLLTIAGLISLIISCASSPTGRKRLPLLVKDPEMNKLGTQAFEEMKKGIPIETDPGINSYVKCIANSIIAVISDDTGVEKWEIVVFRDPTPNAFALPGGKIGVHTGILPVANTAGQLAAVLGHEVGHVLGRHSAERASQNQMMEKATEFATKMAKDNAKTVTSAIGIGGKYGFMLPFSRTHESEADVLGLWYMSDAGFNPEESVQLWKNMASMGGSKPMEIMSTHPSDESRMKNLEDNMKDAKERMDKARAAGKNPACR